VKYLVALSKSFAPRDPTARVDTTKPLDDNEGLGKIINGKVQQPPQPAFKRLHVLYLIHDLLMYGHSHRHEHSQHDYQNSLQILRPEAVKLVSLTVCGCIGNQVSKTRDLVFKLVNIWSAGELFSSNEIEELLSAINTFADLDWEPALAKLSGLESQSAANARQNNFKWVIPTKHGLPGDPSAPWHELPAANGLWMKRTAGFPLVGELLPAGGVRLRGGGQEVDPELKKEVQDLHKAALRCFEKYTKPEDVQDVDALGNIIWKDPERRTTNYWGFTIAGIDKRKEIAKKFADATKGRVKRVGPRGRGNSGFQGRGNGFRGGREPGFMGPGDRSRGMGMMRGRGMGMDRGRGGGGWRGRGRW
jgi:hypothetical protein